MWRILVALLALLPLMGCGKRDKGVVSGTITYNGQPVNGVQLQLSPIPGPGNDITIPVSQEGTFRTSNIPPGEYKIVVTAPQTGRMPAMPKGGDPAKAEEMKKKFQQAYARPTPTIRYPDKYKNILKTDLKCTINQGDQTLNLELKD
ncbi:MAG TPA: carboxypeptidase-like regulatory domain-containing protein [Gemmataceae bacterium]|jgi:hypothetical protein